MQSGLSEYQLSWRQQNVPMTVGSIDATMKCGKALQDLNKRQTVRFSSPALAFTPAPCPPPPSSLPAAQVWSNDVGAPPIAVMVSDASLDNPALVAACNDHKAGVDATGMEHVQLMCGQPSPPSRPPSTTPAPHG